MLPSNRPVQNTSEPTSSRGPQPAAGHQRDRGEHGDRVRRSVIVQHPSTRRRSRRSRASGVWPATPLRQREDLRRDRHQLGVQRDERREAGRVRRGRRTAARTPSSTVVRLLARARSSARLGQQRPRRVPSSPYDADARPLPALARTPTSNGSRHWRRRTPPTLMSTGSSASRRRRTPAARGRRQPQRGARVSDAIGGADARVDGGCPGRCARAGGGAGAGAGAGGGGGGALATGGGGGAIDGRGIDGQRHEHRRDARAVRAVARLVAILAHASRRDDTEPYRRASARSTSGRRPTRARADVRRRRSGGSSVVSSVQHRDRAADRCWCPRSATPARAPARRRASAPSATATTRPPASAP